MDNFKDECGECNSAYKHLTSLRGHTREAHDHRRYLCRSCNIYYKRKHDLIRIHPRLILQKSPSNIECNVPEHSNKGANNLLSTSKIEDHHTMIPNQPSTSTTLHCKPAQNIYPFTHTTRMFEGVSPIDLAKDLEISDGNSENEDPRVVSIITNSHSENPKEVSIATNTDTSGITKPKEGTTNTTPDVRITLSTQQDVYHRTFRNKDLGFFKTPKKEYNTQLGYLDSVQIHNTACQTDVKSCIECNRHDHLINLRWCYWVNDAKTNCNLNPPTIYQSREDNRKLPLFIRIPYPCFCAFRSNITYLEMINMFVALRVWANHWSHSTVKFKLDNLAVVQVVTSGKTRNEFFSAC